MIRGIKISPHHIFGPSKTGGDPQLYQRGNGFELYQRGEGLGNIFSSLYTKVMPWVKKVADSKVVKAAGKEILDSASNAAINLAADVISGKSAKQSANNNLENARQEIAKTIRNANKRTSLDNTDNEVVIAKKPKQSSKKKRKDLKVKIKNIKKPLKYSSYNIFQDE